MLPASEPPVPVVDGTRYPGLDGLRAVAVSMVVCYHVWPDSVPGGFLGVGLFFALSGFLIVGLVDSELAVTGRFRLRRFAARRVRRLLPAALLTVAVSLAATAVFDGSLLHQTAVEGAAAVSNMHNWWRALFVDPSSEPVLGHFWSLAVEEQFYLLVPAAMAFTRRPVVVVSAAAAIGVFTMFWAWGEYGAYFVTPVRGLEIAAGAALALFLARCLPARRWLREKPAESCRFVRVVWWFLVAAALTVTGFAVFGSWFEPPSLLPFEGGPFMMSSCWLVLLSAAVKPGWLCALLSAAPLLWLGQRSYAVYLFHYPLWVLTHNPWVVIVGSVVAAGLSWRFVEEPARRAGDVRWFVSAAVVLLAVCVAVAAGTAA